MRILVSGSTGLVGSALLPLLETSGHQVIRLVRQRGGYDLEGFDAVIHLAGRNIATRWTDRVKQEILLSRVDLTSHLSETLSKLTHPPKVFICASAIGIYGDRKEEVLTEASAVGTGFLATVCKEWEAATLPAKKRGVRCVNARFGIILSPKGGALAKMLVPFRVGLGTILGSGEQYMSWIALQDVIQGLNHVLMNDALEGPVNFTTPNPVTNRTFSEELAKALHRPLFLKIGEKPLRWLLGEMAEEMLLSSARVMPEKLMQSGYHFLYSDLSRFFSDI